MIIRRDVVQSKCGKIYTGLLVREECEFLPFFFANFAALREKVVSRKVAKNAKQESNTKNYNRVI